MTVELPNIRKLFVPDPGYVLYDCDLSGADAQVVAWEAEDEDLKSAFRSGVKIHVKNATDMFGTAFTDLPGDIKQPGTPKGKMYHGSKIRVHATNYGATPRTLAQNPDVGGSELENQTFQTKWFARHPGIRTWHQRTLFNVNTSRTIRNRFGYRIIYFDRPDSVFTQALAWIPQSTVAEVCFRGALQLEARHPYVEMLLQVHDSLVFQVPFAKATASFHRQLKQDLEVAVPYPDPLIIPWGISASRKSWGDCTDLTADLELAA